MSSTSTTTGAGSVVGVLHTGITVSDLDRSLAFFRDVLGFPTSEPVLHTDAIFERVTGVAGAHIRIAFVDLLNHRLELLQYVQPTERGRSSLRPCDAGHLHLALQVRDIDRIVDRMQDAGFEPVGPVQTATGARPLRAIYTVGPDQLYIELMETD